MSIRLTGLEHTAVIVAAAGYGSLLTAGFVHGHGLLIGFLATAALAVGVVSFLKRDGYKTP